MDCEGPFLNMFWSTSTRSVGSMALTEATLSTTSSFAKSQLRPIQPRPWQNRRLLWPFPGNVGLQKGPWVLVQGDEPQDMLPRKAQGQRALLLSIIAPYAPQQVQTCTASPG